LGIRNINFIGKQSRYPKKGFLSIHDVKSKEEAVKCFFLLLFVTILYTIVIITFIPEVHSKIHVKFDVQ